MNKYILLALEEAKKSNNDIPIGAVIVKDNLVISKAHNEVVKRNDATAHAEILAIQKACKKLNTYNLSECSIYSTLEPCPMCTGAIINAKIGKVVYGAMDIHYGACGSRYNLLSNNKAKKTEVYAGIEEEKCKNLISEFFKKLRKK